MVQDRRHVPSMPIIWALTPRENPTRSALRFSVRVMQSHIAVANFASFERSQ
jgi:hypothetical protein